MCVDTRSIYTYSWAASFRFIVNVVHQSFGYETTECAIVVSGLATLVATKIPHSIVLHFVGQCELL